MRFTISSPDYQLAPTIVRGHDTPGQPYFGQQNTISLSAAEIQCKASFFEPGLCAFQIGSVDYRLTPFLEVKCLNIKKLRRP